MHTLPPPYPYPVLCDGIRAESTATALSDINLSSNELSESSCVAIAALLTVRTPAGFTFYICWEP